MPTRTCDQCGKHLITHRADARFCDERCRARWNNKHRNSATPTDIRIASADGAVGSRGGNVRTVDEARVLQSESKERDRWRLIMEIQIHRTLLATGYFHVDDLDPLGVPPIASEVKGTLINSVRARGYMKSTEVRRKVAHAAANARKAPIYKITAKGRRELPGLVEDLTTDLAGVSADGPSAPGFPAVEACDGKKAASMVSTHSGDSGLTGPGGGVGVANPQGPPGLEAGSIGADTAWPDNQTLAGVGGESADGAPVPPPSPGGTPHSGEKASTDVSGTPTPDRVTSSLAPAIDAGEDPSAPSPCAEGSSARLFDLDEARERPRSAFADPEAA